MKLKTDIDKGISISTEDIEKRDSLYGSKPSKASKPKLSV
jgi:hypothetical protein